jgi:hypothetical protein
LPGRPWPVAGAACCNAASWPPVPTSTFAWRGSPGGTDDPPPPKRLRRFPPKGAALADRRSRIRGACLKYGLRGLATKAVGLQSSLGSGPKRLAPGLPRYAAVVERATRSSRPSGTRATSTQAAGAVAVVPALGADGDGRPQQRQADDAVGRVGRHARDAQQRLAEQAQAEQGADTPAPEGGARSMRPRGSSSSRQRRHGLLQRVVSRHVDDSDMSQTLSNAQPHVNLAAVQRQFSTRY